MAAPSQLQPWLSLGSKGNDNFVPADTSRSLGGNTPVNCLTSISRIDTDFSGISFGPYLANTMMIMSVGWGNVERGDKSTERGLRSGSANIGSPLFCNARRPCPFFENCMCGVGIPQAEHYRQRSTADNIASGNELVRGLLLEAPSSLCRSKPLHGSVGVFQVIAFSGRPPRHGPNLRWRPNNLL